jgi:hypothetical protein
MVSRQKGQRLVPSSPCMHYLQTVWCILQIITGCFSYLSYYEKQISHLLMALSFSARLFRFAILYE